MLGISVIIRICVGKRTLNSVKNAKDFREKAQLNLSFGFESIQGYLSACFWCTIFVFLFIQREQRSETNTPCYFFKST